MGLRARAVSMALRPSQKELPRAVLTSMTSHPSVSLGRDARSTGILLYRWFRSGSVESPANPLCCCRDLTQLGGADGIAFLQALDIDNRLLGIVMTGHGNIELAVRAMQNPERLILPNRFKSSWSGWRVSRLLELTGCDRKTPCHPHADLSRQYSTTSRAAGGFSVGGNRRLERRSTESLNGCAEGESVRPGAGGRAARQQSLVAFPDDTLGRNLESLHETVEEEIASPGLCHRPQGGAGCRRKARLIVTQVRTALATPA